MRAKTRELLQHCIEIGIASGYARAHKHDESPSAGAVQDSVEMQIWDMIDEYFDFEEPYNRKD